MTNANLESTFEKEIMIDSSIQSRLGRLNLTEQSNNIIKTATDSIKVLSKGFENTFQKDFELQQIKQIEVLESINHNHMVALQQNRRLENIQNIKRIGCFIEVIAICICLVFFITKIYRKNV
ncbi:hypothetical protein HZQ35_08700 [Elizabethkingia anophelis]|nr:hypothetical protein [Elizabethkingia anophelis]MCT3633681.1 hypothetical protein [Elizabethkingia anophelis]MCT3830386.1 hypothetical protein [Elizabethkingia anophelis]MCT3883885.1 hypothetical protein [Elizabethkingia anophelis]MCT3894653.1 hypothetical protein [Elizabethkingia anophelis]